MNVIENEVQPVLVVPLVGDGSSSTVVAPKRRCLVIEQVYGGCVQTTIVGGVVHVLQNDPSVADCGSVLEIVASANLKRTWETPDQKPSTVRFSAL